MKIPEKIKRVIKIMKPDSYEIRNSSRRFSNTIFKYYVYLEYDDWKLHNISSLDLSYHEVLLIEICKKEDAYFCITRK